VKYEFQWKCATQGSSCIGHLETDEHNRYTMMPSSLTAKIGEIKNRYQRYKERLLSDSISYERYKTLVSKTMMGKKGNMRSLNSIRVDGTIKMVISVGKSCKRGTLNITVLVC
jgi:hypothetical protein